MRRASGISVPLFSLISRNSWGIGEFPDMATFCRWATEAGQSLVQILPVMELPESELSPYSALTSFALDPTYIAVARVPDFSAMGGERQFDAEDTRVLDEIRRSPRVMHAEVRRLKHRWLRRAWECFAQHDLERDTPRAAAFREFCQRQAWWLDDYSAYRALLADEENRPWWHWPEPQRSGSDEVVRGITRSLASEVSYRKYLQWIADGQWLEARQSAAPARVFGDLPFMISGNSADVWRRQTQFRLDATVGAPPDAFAPDGQDWGLPPWRWQALRDTDYAWMRQRALRHAYLFDGFRIDHLVGLYRAWVRPLDSSQPPFFDPADETVQQMLGETLVSIFVGSGAELIAEDLGTVPAFVRRSITALGVPGFKVLRWERHWDHPGQPSIDPASFPALSVATTGTHDIDPLATNAPPEQVEEGLRDLQRSGSALALLPLQDAFGWPDRINTPSVVDDVNWTWRVPRPVDEWSAWPEAVARQARLRSLARETGR